MSPRRRLLVALLVLLWIFFVLYPNPTSLSGSLKRLVKPPVDPDVVRNLAAMLPDDHAAVESFSEDYVEYRDPWTLYGEPWRFPTLNEVLVDAAGDCQAEALLTASLLEAKDLPYKLHYSFDHVWVDYPGKAVSSLEDPSTAFVSDEGEGWLANVPGRIPLRDIVEARVAFHWTPMPAARKALLFVGLASLVGLVEWRILSSLGRQAAAYTSTFGTRKAEA